MSESKLIIGEDIVLDHKITYSRKYYILVMGPRFGPLPSKILAAHLLVKCVNSLAISCRGENGIKRYVYIIYKSILFENLL